MSGPAFARCEDCDAAIFPVRVSCPACGSSRLAGAMSAGRGVVYSTTTVMRREGAHDVSLVDLAEGFRMMSEVVGIDPAEVRIGMEVRAREDGEGRIVFDAR
jgi:uncharacterized OB-fold protein